jgi:hypothetical protein
MFQEVGSTVNEKNPHARSKRTRVLRATDVIPPFDKNIEPPDAGQAGQAEVVTLDSGDKGQNAAGGSVAAAAPARHATDRAASSAEAVQIPSYDLAANILADQRRAASRRRRAPGQVDDKPTRLRNTPDAQMAAGEPLPRDLLELQRIVAEIVARDIERLCRRPNRQSVAHV